MGKVHRFVVISSRVALRWSTPLTGIAGSHGEIAGAEEETFARKEITLLF